MEFITQAIAWMRLPENANLAGWAQAVGATVALALAIGVPAYQRHAQLLDMRRQQAGLNLALATSGRFLLNDVVIFLNGLISLRSLPRASCRDDVQVSSLLERIHAIESREISHARIVTLYSARGTLILANRALCNPDIQNKPLSEGEIQNIKNDLNRLDERHRLANFDADYSLGITRGVNASWPARPIIWVIAVCLAHYKHQKVPLKDRLFGTK